VSFLAVTIPPENAFLSCDPNDDGDIDLADAV
jgi:hypothetical protein